MNILFIPLQVILQFLIQWETRNCSSLMFPCCSTLPFQVSDSSRILHPCKTQANASSLPCLLIFGHTRLMLCNSLTLHELLFRERSFLSRDLVLSFRWRLHLSFVSKSKHHFPWFVNSSSLCNLCRKLAISCYRLFTVYTKRKQQPLTQMTWLQWHWRRQSFSSTWTSSTRLLMKRSCYEFLIAFYHGLLRLDSCS